MSDSKDDFNRLRAQFSRRANARGIPALASKLCWWIAYGHMNLKSRSTFVSQITLADDLGGVTVRSVQRMINVLKPLGLNVAPGHGPNRASTYWIGEANTTSVSPIEEANTTSVSPIQPGQGDTGVGSTRHLTTDKATPVSPLLKKNSKKVSNKSAPDGQRVSPSSIDRPVPEPRARAGTETPIERAEALIGTVPEPEQQAPVGTQQPLPERVNSIGAGPNGGQAGPGSDAVCRSARKLFGAKGDAVAARLLAALGGDFEEALDHLAVAADEADPMNYLKLEVERTRLSAENQKPWRMDDD